MNEEIKTVCWSDVINRNLRGFFCWQVYQKGTFDMLLFTEVEIT